MHLFRTVFVLVLYALSSRSFYLSFPFSFRWWVCFSLSPFSKICLASLLCSERLVSKSLMELIRVFALNKACHARSPVPPQLLSCRLLLLPCGEMCTVAPRCSSDHCSVMNGCSPSLRCPQLARSSSSRFLFIAPTATVQVHWHFKHFARSPSNGLKM